jgi:hypothetical protein
LQILKYQSACFRAAGNAISAEEMDLALKDVIRDEALTPDVLDGLAAVSKKLRHNAACIALFDESLARQLRSARIDMTRVAKQYRMLITLYNQSTHQM